MTPWARGGEAGAPAARRRYSTRWARGDLGQVGGRDLDGQGLAAVDQDVAAAVEDLAALGGDGDVADPVDGGRVQVLVTGEDLQEPEPEEDDREHGQREAPHDGDAQGELGGHRRPAILGVWITASPRGIGAQPLRRRLQRAQAAGRVGAAAPAARVVGQRGLHDPAHQRVDGERDQRVDQHGDEDLLEQQPADRGIDAEQELDDGHPDPGHGGGRRAGRQRHQPVGGIAELAQSPGPVADRDVEQRGDAKGLHEHRVDQQPGPEAHDRARHRAGQQPDRHDHQRGQVGADPEDRDLRHGRLLDDHGHQGQQRSAARGSLSDASSPAPEPALFRRAAGSGSGPPRDGGCSPREAPGPAGC